MLPSKGFISITLLALSIFNSGCGAQDRRPMPSWRLTHSAEKQSPYSTLKGRTITVMPIGPSFDIPESWTKRVYGKNLFLSWDDLNEVNKPQVYDFEGGETAVMDAVLPFESCAVHAGEKGWNSGTISDQLRFYVTDEKVETIHGRIEKDGFSVAKANFDKASISQKQLGNWKNMTISFVDAPTHAILLRDIAFFVSSQGDKTFVMVFLHPGGEQLIQSTLNSFVVSR